MEVVFLFLIGLRPSTVLRFSLTANGVSSEDGCRFYDF